MRIARFEGGEAEGMNSMSPGGGGGRRTSAEIHEVGIDEKRPT